MTNRVSGPRSTQDHAHNGHSSAEAAAAVSRQTGPICVLGMHGSGTSLTTYAIGQLGWTVGDPAHLMPADEFNPKGYWENSLLTALNDEIFQRLGGTWYAPPVLNADWERSADLFDLRTKAEALLQQELGSGADWVWKDPRLSLTLPFWLPMLPPKTRFVICYRNPLEVCGTFKRRADMTPQKCSFLWQHYLASALVATEGKSRFFMPYEGWFKEDRREPDRLAGFVLGAESPGRIQAVVRDFLADSLRHHHHSAQSVFEEAQIEFAAKWLYQALQGLGDTAETLTKICRSLLDSNRARRSMEDTTAAALSRTTALTMESRSLIKQLNQATELNNRLENQLAEFRKRLEASEKQRHDQAESSVSRVAEMQRSQSELLQKVAGKEARIEEMLKFQQLLQHTSSVKDTRLIEAKDMLLSMEKKMEEKAAGLAEAQKNLVESQQAFQAKEQTLNRHLAARTQQVLNLQKQAAHREAVLVLKQKMVLEQQTRLQYLDREMNRMDSVLCHVRAQLAALYETKTFRYMKWPRAIWSRLHPSSRPKAPTAVKKQSTLSRVKIRQVYFSEDQKPFLMPEAVGYFNDHADPFLESRVLVDSFHRGDHKDCDYYGVFSWRFEQKFKGHIKFDAIRGFIDSRPKKAHVYSFFWSEPDENVWKRAVELWHPPLFVEIAQKLFRRIGYPVDVLELKTSPIYSNHWLATPEVFEQFVRAMLLPAIQVMEKDAEIRALCFQDSGYSKLFEDPGYREAVGHDALSPEECLRLFGKPYYTYHPFICERLISSWLAMRPDLKLEHIPETVTS